jgi:CheY-like chemotaxis protein
MSAPEGAYSCFEFQSAAGRGLQVSPDATEHSLSKAGHLVSTAADGEEALEVAKEKLPDIIRLDRMLPKISGPNVLKALKENPATRHIPVIVFTSLSQKNEEELISEGAAAYFEKSAQALDQNFDLLATTVRDGARPQVDQKAPDQSLCWWSAGRPRPARRAHDSGDRLKR